MRPNYDKSLRLAYYVIKKYGTRTVPVSLCEIINKIKNIKLQSYTQFCKAQGLKLDEAILILGSAFGAIIKYPNKERYIIYYNDNTMNEELNRFTIAHELGHYFLNHINKYGNCARKGVIDEEYSILEKESDCFARNLLCPIPLFDNIYDKDCSVYSDNWNLIKVSEVFEITVSASQARISLSSLDRFRNNESYTEFFKGFSFECGRYCLVCYSHCSDLNFCPFCGTKLKKIPKTILHYELERFMEDILMIYDGNYIKKCLTCGNENVEDIHNYCFICGENLENRCINNECYNSTPNTEFYNSFRYCPLCGSKSYYFNEGILSACDYKSDDDFFTIEEDDEKLPF